MDQIETIGQNLDELSEAVHFLLTRSPPYGLDYGPRNEQVLLVCATRLRIDEWRRSQMKDLTEASEMCTTLTRIGVVNTQYLAIKEREGWMEQFGGYALAIDDAIGAML